MKRPRTPAPEGDPGDDSRELEGIDARELSGWRRALDALPPAQRAMVLRMARVLSLAAALPATRPGRTRIKPVDGPDGKLLGAGNDNAGDDGKLLDGEARDGDELSRELARRILRRHRGRSSGGAA